MTKFKLQKVTKVIGVYCVIHVHEQETSMQSVNIIGDMLSTSAFEYALALQSTLKQRTKTNDILSLLSVRPLAVSENAHNS